MGKQSNKSTSVSQAQFDKDLDQSLEILHKDGASDQELIDYTNDYKSRFTVAKPTPTPRATTQKKNPNQNGDGNTENGSSDSQEIDPATGFPKIDTNGPLPNFKEMKSVGIPPKTKGEQSKAIFKDAKAKVDSNLTEENLQTEKEQSGFLNTAGQFIKDHVNVLATPLNKINELAGGDKDYFSQEKYKPLQDQQKKYIDKAKRENLPLTPEAIQKGAEDIFRQEDKFKQLQKNIDAALPEGYDREGIWKDLKLENLKKNDALRQAVVTADVYQKQITDFDKFYESIKNVPQGSLTKEQIDTYNDLLTDAKESQEGLGYLQDTFPKLLKEVKTSDELLDVFKYNYNDYERAYSNIKNFGKRLGYGTLKIAAETASYIDQKTDEEGSAPTEADKTFKNVLQATKDVANDNLDEARQEGEQFISYKAKDINNISDFGSYMTDLGTNQLPLFITLAIAPELGSALLGTSSAGDQFRNMEKEEMQPFAKTTSFGQKLATSYIYGAAETLFEKLGTVKVLKNIEQSIARASNTSRKLMQESVLSSVSGSAKRLGFNTFLEGGTEYLTAEAQIQADRHVAGKEVSAQQANENRFESFTGGALMGNSMTMVGGLWGGIAQQAQLYSDSQDIKKTTEILSKIDVLSDELKNNPNLTKEDKDIIHKKMNDLANESFDIVVKNAEKGKTFSKEENSFLVAVNLMQDGLKKEFEKIKNSNLSTEQKQALTDDLNAHFNQLEQDRNATLKGEFSTIPDSNKIFRPEVPQEDNLLDDETPTPETQPQTEVPQQAEAEKVEDVVTPQEQSDEDLLNELEVDNEESSTTTETLPEITDQEYLDFVENDFLSNERLNDVAAKVRENKDLTTYEKRIAKKKEKEILDINKKVQDEANEVIRKVEVDTLSKIPAMQKDEFLEYSKTEKASQEKINSIAYKKANNVELNNFEKEVYQDNKKVVDKLNREKNLKENILDKIPTEQKYQTKEGKFTVAKNGTELELYDTNGQPATLTPATKQKYFLEALENGFMKRTTDLQIPEGITEADIESFELENETDPSVILEKLLATDPKIDGESISDIKDYAIAIYINKVTQKSFVRFGDKNNITRGIALTYFSKEGRQIDDLADEIASKMGIEVGPEDIVDFILANPNGTRSILYPKNPAYQNLIDKFVELTGFRPTPSQIMDFNNKEVPPTQIDFEFANDVEVNDETLERIDLEKAAEKFDKWFLSLTPQEQVEFYFDLEEDYPNAYYQQRYNEQQDYEQSEKITSTGTPNSKGESKPDGSLGQNPQQAGSGSGNNNVPGRNSGETQTENGESGGNEGTGNQSGTPQGNASDRKQGGTTGSPETGSEGVKSKTEAKQEQAEAPQPEPKQSKRKISDEKAKEEIDNLWAKFKKGGNNMMMGGIDPEKLALGIEIVSLYAKQGIYKFSEIIEDAYANMGEELKDLFDEIKSVYASFRENADEETYSKLDENTRGYTYESIIKNLKNDEQAEQPIAEQPITDTKPIELKTKAIESKTDKLANDREAEIPAERKLEIANDLLFDIDSEIENVNDQLRLLGFYEPNKNDAMRENPHIYIERELKKDLTNFVKKLNERLKWEFDTDRKGKPQIASANVAPAGGDGTFILWVPNSEYGIYVSVSVQPKEYKDWYEQYELEPSIMWRVTTKKDKYGGLSNQWMNSEDFTIPNLVDKFTKATNFYLKQENGSNNQQQPEQGVSNPIGTLQPNSKRPIEGSSQELLQKPSEEQGTGTRSQPQSNPVSPTTRTVKQPSTGQGDLFSGNAGVLETETAPTPQKPKDKVEVQIEQINQAEKQEPALVDFSLQDNEQDKFNATKKYTDNINALETLLTIIKEKRKATPEEKNTLARYVGFGGLKEIAFNPDNDAAWKESTAKYKAQVRKVIELTQELDKALGINNSLAEIRAGILTAHYTPKTVIDTMFNVLERLGFKNGNILEPSAGIGNFIGYMPSKMRSNSSITAVELDNLTGNILKYLYDDANTQITGIQNALIANNSQDVVISNVPFGNFKIFDKEFKGPREFLTKRIHNYFFAKALDKVREGGIVMFVTSKGVLDSKGNQDVREYLNQNADFLGAVRLPSTIFQNNANTSVVTDIIILRKNTTGEKKNPNFIDVVDLEVTDKNGEIKIITINKFFADNREVLMGEIVPGGMYSEKDYSLIDPNNTMQYIGERLGASNLRHYFGTFQPTTNLNATNRIDTDQDLLHDTKVGNLTISGEGKILKRLETEMQEVSFPAYVRARNVKKYIDTRIALFDLITAEYTGQPDSVVDGLRSKLNTIYSNAIQSIPAKEFNRIANEDGDGFNVLGLTDKFGKRADILSKRTINPLQQKQNADNIEEAIIISLSENAKIDIDRIAELMNKPVKEIMEIAKGKIFESPTGGFFTRDEYLSGNVKKKLAEVNKAIESGYTEFENNKTELEAVLPKDIPVVSIEVRLGSRWVPLDIIQDFADHLFKGDGVIINYMKSTDTYNNQGKAHSVNSSEKWGTKRKDGADLLIDALHLATPVITVATEDGKRVVDKIETEKAVQKYEEIRAEFEDWIYKDAERRERLGKIYNDKYNTTVKRKYDGSHLSIPGINGVTLLPHQKDGVWMLLQNNGGIIDHIVGSGKTYLMVAATAEMKRTGVAKKPIILALKATVPQIVETYKKAYPLAKILAPSEKDFQAKNRQKILSQIAINDWDVIILSHDNYKAIPHHPDYVKKQIEDEIAEIEAERDALSSDKKAMAGLEKRLNNLEVKLERLTNVPKDNIVYFQQMGIDHIMVDESQEFKNLAYMTKLKNVAGLAPPEGSQKSFNLLIGLRSIQETLGADKGGTFLSGTPISNSMVEMYSLLKYMRPNNMSELGFNTFDQWATTFANPSNEIEYTVTGEFKSKTRVRQFINVPELSLMYNEIADVRDDSNLILDKPKMKGDDYTTVIVPMNEEQADYGKKLIEFAKTKDPKVLGISMTEKQLRAYMLIVTTLSTKMSIDMRLINKSFKYDPNGKIGKLTDQVLKIYNETNEHKGTQLIFSDTGTPKNKNNQAELLKDYLEDDLGVPFDTLVEIFGNFGEEGHRYQPIAKLKQKAIEVLEIEENDFDEYVNESKNSADTFNIYSEVKLRLIEKGIPENEVVFIHSYPSQAAKEKLFEQVNSGEIRVVLGSTKKLGTGVNVQERLAGIHHLDALWNPAGMEQRNGRALRQGNWIAKTHLNNEVPISVYATERTLDAYKFQLMQTKDHFLKQIKLGNIEDRVITEEDEEGGFAAIVAELSGNKDILLKFKLQQEKERIIRQRRNFEGALYEAQGKIKDLEREIPDREGYISKVEKDIEGIVNKAEYEVTIDKETGEETKKLKINNINGEVLQPEKDSKNAKEKKPVDRIEYGKKAVELIAQTVKTIKLGTYTKSFEINGLPILVEVDNYKEMNNGKEFVIQKTSLAILAPSGDLYDFRNSSVPGVLLNNLQKAIEGIPDHISNSKYYLAQNKKDLIDYKELVKNDKFPKEEELARITEELKEIDKRIQDFEKDPEEEALQDDNVVNEPSEAYGSPKLEPFSDVVNGFYSPLERVIAQAKQDKLPAKQWIEKFAKGEEAKWTGLTEWLSQQQGSVSKAEIQNYLKDNRIEIVEVEKNALKSNKQYEVIDNEGYDARGEAIEINGGNPNGQIETYDDVLINDFVADENGYYSESTGYRLNNWEDEENNGDTKFSTYQVEGEKENYKEVLVTLPDNVEKKRKELYTKYIDASQIDANSELSKKLQQELKDFGKAQGLGKFKSSHFDEANILVHLRMNTRTDADGKKVLFLEEVQSDWGQQGKKKGFAVTDNEKRKKELLAKEELTKEEIAELGTFDNTYKLPQAPFVTDTNAWAKLGLKVALKEAVAQGVDKIAWTTGEQQNDRYDLSKKLDYVTKHNESRVNKENNSIDVTISVNNGLMGVVVDKSNGIIKSQNGSSQFGEFKDKGLDEVIGKDIADKILKLDDTEHILKGDGLKIGGKGMKGFYGSPTEGSLGIIGEVAKALTKQDPKIVNIVLKNYSDGSSDFYVRKSGDSYGVYKAENGELVTKGFDSYDSATDYADSITSDKKISTQHSIEITPLLKQSISGGIPLFKINGTLALNKTQDGQEFLSLSEPGSEYSNSSQPNLWEQGDRDSGDNNRRSVRAVWTKYKNLQFKGTTKIKSAEDVAQIMSLLENKSVEHAFAIHIDQKGNSQIQFLSIGGVTGTVVDTNLVAAGVSKFNSVKVYLVHNHPSGTMLPSSADIQITKTLRDGLNPLGITVEHIIMDTDKKEYVHIDNDNLFTVNTRGENTFKTTLTPIALTEQEILGNHFGKVTDANKAFSIIQNFRFSAFPKNAMLVLNNANEVIGNYVFSNGDITYKEVVDFVGETATARAVIFYGNQSDNLDQVKEFQIGLGKLSINILDKIVTSSDNERVHEHYTSMSNTGMLNEHLEKYGTGNQKFNEVNEPSANKDLRLPQIIARQVLNQMREDSNNKVPTNDRLKNAVTFIQNTDWYNDLDATRQQRVNNTTIKSLLENAIKEINYLEDKVEEYKQKLKDNKLTTRQVFDDIVAFLQTNKIKGKITPTEVNRLIKAAVQITVKRDTEKALDDFMNLYEVIKEKALLRSDKGAKDKAEVDYVIPIVESLVASGYDLDVVLDYFDTNSQKRMAEIQYHKEKSKYAYDEDRIKKANETLEKQKQDLHNATYTSFREGLKKARLYWFNLISDRSYVPAELMSKTGMQQTYYQFKNTKGYGHSAKEMFEKVYDKVWKGLTKEKIQLLHDVIQMMRIITIDDNRNENGLAPVQHPNNLSKDDAQAWLISKKTELGEKEFNNIGKRANEYFKAYKEVLDLKMENGFISEETYDALNGLDYQPRMFLHHAVNFDGDLSFEQTKSIETRSGLSKEQVLKLDDGSANSLISDAQWLLSNSISTLYQDIADNTLNQLFIAKELPIAQAKYDELLSGPQDQLTKEEKRFIKYFKELSEKAIPNEIIGFSANTNDPVYKSETPKHFVNKYYWADGVKHQFFMEEKLAQEFDGAKGLFLNESNKATVGNLTGARLVKYFATGNNPLFVIVNTPRDFMWNILVSEHYSSVVPLAMAQMTYQLFPSTYDFIRTKLGRENTDMNLYLQHGGSMDYLHKQGDIADKSFADKYIVKTLTSVLGKNNQPRVEDAIKNNYVTKVVGALNEWSELAFRIATFRRSINAQLKELGFNNESEITDLIDENGAVTQTRQEILDNVYRKATYDARSILDFSQGGRLIKDLEEFVPYLNVGVQATRSYADAMKKRPISTTLKTFQIATGGAAAFIALAMFMLAGDDDEPEEEKGKTVERKYVEFTQGVSEETRSKYYLIPTKQRDENGNRIAYKIAKDQLLIPYTNIVETLIENRIRTRAGFKEVSYDKINHRLYKDVLEYNLSAKTIKDVPLFKAGTAWYAGYDLYRNKPLDKYAKAEALEGMDNPQVEDFYKHLGAQWKVSPIRTKSAIESMITSPQSNPYLATGYEVMDYAFTDKSMQTLGSGVKEMLLKGLKNRTTTKSTEWTRAESLLSDKKKEQLNAMLKEEATRQLFKDKAQDVIDKKVTAEEVVKDLQSQYGSDPNYKSYIKSFRTTIKGELRVEGTDGMMQRIKREKSPGAKAIMIREIYGDINSPENEELKNELIGKRIINNATLRYLEKKAANQ